MRIAVLGAGAGGTAIAFDCASHGHEVRLFDFPQFPGNIEAVARQAGIHADGDISGFANIASASHDIDEALLDAELIYVVGPAYSTTPFGEAVAGKLEAGQTVVVTPSSCGGALAFKKAAGLGLGDDAVRVAETSTLHYAVRLTEPGRIRVFLKLKAGNLLAALPGKDTGAVLKLVEDVYPSMEPARGIMQTSLQNANRSSIRPSRWPTRPASTPRASTSVLRRRRQRRDGSLDRGAGQRAHRHRRQDGRHRHP